MNFKFMMKRIWLIVVAIFISIVILNCFFDIKVFIFGISPNFLMYILFLISIICPIIIFNYNKENIKVWKLMYTISVFLIIVISIFFYMLSCSGNKYFTFKSPQKTNILIVEEKSFLLSGVSTFYEKKSDVFIKSLDVEIDTDDGFRPFSSDSYEIDWINENTVNIKYDYGSSFGWKSEIISLK